MPPAKFYDVADLTTKRDVGSQMGTQWFLSSHKLHHGVDQLRKNDLQCLWQSDGMQPHTIAIRFSRRTAVTHVSMYLDVKMDDSYTPTKIQIKAGTSFHDLLEVRYREFEAPEGWKHFLLDKTNPSVGEEDEHTIESALAADKCPQPPIYVYLLQINVLANHLNGKDTHVRGAIVFGPLEEDRDHRRSTNPIKQGDDAELVRESTRSMASLALKELESSGADAGEHPDSGLEEVPASVGREAAAARGTGRGQALGDDETKHDPDLSRLLAGLPPLTQEYSVYSALR